MLVRNLEGLIDFVVTKLSVISDTASHLLLRMVIHTFGESCLDVGRLWSLYASFLPTLFISMECL